MVRIPYRRNWVRLCIYIHTYRFQLRTAGSLFLQVGILANLFGITDTVYDEQAHSRHSWDVTSLQLFIQLRKTMTFTIWRFLQYFSLHVRYHDIYSRRIRVHTLRPKQNGRHFADDTFKYIFLNENFKISANISLKFVPKGPINNIPALDQIMAWRRSGDKPFSEPMMVRLPTHVCVTRPQWVNALRSEQNDQFFQIISNILYWNKTLMFEFKFHWSLFLIDNKLALV